MINRMIVRTEIGTGQLAELVKQVQAGNEVLLTQSDKPVAKVVPALENGVSSVAVRLLAAHGPPATFNLEAHLIRSPLPEP